MYWVTAVLTVYVVLRVPSDDWDDVLRWYLLAFLVDVQPFWSVKILVLLYFGLWLVFHVLSLLRHCLL